MIAREEPEHLLHRGAGPEENLISALVQRATRLFVQSLLEALAAAASTRAAVASRSAGAVSREHRETTVGTHCEHPVVRGDVDVASAVAD